MIETLSAFASAALVSALWQGALLVLATVLLLRLMPGLAAATRSAVWLTVFAFVVALHFVHPAPTSAGETTIHAAPIWSLLLAGTWASLSLYRTAQLISSVRRVRDIHRGAKLITLSGPVPEIGRHYQVCTSPDVDRPCVLGFFSPRVLLPPGLAEELAPAELHQVLLHETEHLRRSDDWTNLLQKLALVVFPLNPALLYIEGRLCAERELACDDRVLADGSGRKSYATCLTHLAEHSILSRGLTLALGAWHRPSELSRRVRRILAPAEPRMHPRMSRLAGSTLALLLAVGGAILARAPRLVSFSPVAGRSLATVAFNPNADAGTTGPAVRTWVPTTATTAFSPATDTGTAGPVSPTWVPTTARRASLHRRPGKHRQPELLATTLGSLSEPASGMTITLTSDEITPHQVQPRYTPAVLRVPVAYAAVRTPDGWIIFQL